MGNMHQTGQPELRFNNREIAKAAEKPMFHYGKDWQGKTPERQEIAAFGPISF
jgi:hypothetical protein